ncbi:hypothetical protein [Thalassotalea sp. SU-HH00458]|uniref:hypothetical protein n=1 Tax=Thalassotalea sp. SU-HH00458 TaxID=3127657 RepID=UPI00310BC7E0
MAKANKTKNNKGIHMLKLTTHKTFFNENIINFIKETSDTYDHGLSISDISYDKKYKIFSFQATENTAHQANVLPFVIDLFKEQEQPYLLVIHQEEIGELDIEIITEAA